MLMMFIMEIKISIKFPFQYCSRSNTLMTPSEKESQTKSSTEMSHNSVENNDNKDDLTSETSSLHLYHSEWNERQLEQFQPTKFTFRDALPQV